MDADDADFIAHARTDIPLLLDALSAANARVAELENVCTRNLPHDLAFYTAQPPTEEPGK